MLFYAGEPSDAESKNETNENGENDDDNENENNENENSNTNNENENNRKENSQSQSQSRSKSSIPMSSGLFVMICHFMSIFVIFLFDLIDEPLTPLPEEPKNKEQNVVSNININTNTENKENNNNNNNEDIIMNDAQNVAHLSSPTNTHIIPPPPPSTKHPNILHMLPKPSKNKPKYVLF